MQTVNPTIPPNWGNLPVVLYPNPVLLQNCVEIDKTYPIQELVAALKNICDMPHVALGLAACQLGIPVRVFMADKKVFINPVIIEFKGLPQTGNESCLSLPRCRGRVTRYQKIKVQWFDENWQEHTQIFRARPAIIIQHEMDHLNGVLFIDHLNASDVERNANELSRLSNGVAPNTRYPIQPYLPTIN